MCGFVGCFQAETARPDNALDLTAALHILQRRGPDGQGVFRNEWLTMGHARLAVIDPSDAGKQPMTDASGRYVIAFNGEIYNFRELFDRYCRDDRTVNQHSDTAVLLALYKRLGRQCVNHLNGMFAFVIVDLVQRTLFMARDRFGEKPLYWRRHNGDLLFASEMRVLKALRPAAPWKLDPQSVGIFQMVGSIPATKTIYRDVQALQAGSWMHVEASGQVSEGSYWTIERSLAGSDSAFSKHTYQEVLEETQKHLIEAGKSRMVSDVEVGIFLSGGLDSGSILSLLHAAKYTKLQALCLDFPEQQYSEYAGAQITANRFQSILHRSVLSANQFLDGMADYFASMDQPTSDGYNTYFVSRAARELGIKVWLSGVGGDELFGGYPSFKRIGRLKALALAMQRTFPTRMVPWAASWTLKCPRITRLLHLADPGDPVIRAYQVCRNTLPVRSAWLLLAPALRKELGTMEDNLDRLYPATEHLSDDFQRATVLESAIYMRSELLRDMDNFSMAHSLELRAPYLDHRLFEYVSRLPERFKQQRGRVKPLLVDALPLPLPEEIVRGNKLGFTFPVEDWLKHHLASSFEQYVLHTDNEAFWDLDVVSALWSAYCKRKVGYLVIWNLYAFARWVRDHRESL